MKDFLEVASVSDQQEHVLLWLTTFGNRQHWEVTFVDRLQLAVMEAVANAMEHGNEWDASKKVVVKIKAQAEWVEVIVQDEGKGYSVETQQFDLPDVLSEGGRGLFLMRQLTDELHFISNGVMLQFKQNRQKVE